MLNKFFIKILLLTFSFVYSFTFANEPVDIWSIDKKKDEKNSINTINENDDTENLIIQDTLISNIEEGEIINQTKIVGLYDPEENGFGLEMWNNTNPKKIFELSKKISKMDLSEDAKKIYTKLLLTNSYSPSDELEEKEFLNIKSEWLFKYNDIELNKEYLKKNIDIDQNEKLTRFVLDELFSINEKKEACEFIDELNINFKDN